MPWRQHGNPMRAKSGSGATPARVRKIARMPSAHSRCTRDPQTATETHVAAHMRTMGVRWERQAGAPRETDNGVSAFKKSRNSKMVPSVSETLSCSYSKEKINLPFKNFPCMVACFFLRSM